MNITTVEQVAEWLGTHRCPMTAVELYHEWREVHHEICPSLLIASEQAATGMDFSEFLSGEWTQETASNLVEEAIVNLLTTFKAQHGEPALMRVLRRVLRRDGSALLPGGEARGAPALASVCLPSVDMLSSSTDMGSASKRDVAEEQDVPFLLQKAIKTEEELSRATALLTERLPVLVRVVDPLQKEALIPLIALCATIGSKKSARVSARLQLLTLYMRPSSDHRLVIAEAWAKTLQQAPLAVIQQEIVPELYNLANSKVSERRILALCCVEAVEPLINDDDIASRCSICQGLLWPLSEDESRTVRCHIVRCLTALWPKFPQEPVCAEAYNSGAMDECLNSFIELMLRLILHDMSTVVRRRALKSLRDLLQSPTSVPRLVAMKRVVPIMFSFIVKELSFVGEESAFRGSSAPNAATLAVAPEVSKEAGASREKGDVLNEIIARNTLTLASLVGDALRCPAESLMVEGKADRVSNCIDKSINSSGSESRKSDLHWSPATPLMLSVYLNEVMPSAHSLLRLSCEQDGLDIYICAVAASLTALVPTFSLSEWKRVRCSVQSFVTAQSDLSETEASVFNEEWLRRRLCFLYAFLASVAAFKHVEVENKSSHVRNIAGDAAKALREAIVAFPCSQVGPPCQEGDRLTMAHIEANTQLSVCASCFACFIRGLGGAYRNGEAISAAVLSVLCSLTESDGQRDRLLVIALVERISSMCMTDEIRTQYLWPPLALLMKDESYDVREAAVKAVLSMTTTTTTPSSQEEILLSVLQTVEKAGFLSQLSVAFLLHWSSLMRVMPAELREQLLYKHLISVVEELAHVMRQGGGCQEKIEPKGAVANTNACRNTHGVLQAVLVVLASIPRCAVVTPQPVRNYLIPCIQLLSSIPSLPEPCRLQLVSINREYKTMLSPSDVKPHDGGGFLERIRQVIKKRF
ncbi:hypothetical protein ERJ75_001354100 [Trypanosoma vivax]|uniref:Uncharacterized protein n=1 Tax=Trypanosoma vivax (strain Y486) TaxID=1055687 RepID=G0UCW1_TRYVY|nr:hypothetical protein TRVL_00885 [Trypanosoma vivax]KAH8607896.1 hypothetical protein ERJ75_001354100 [Trypanosoma vivax]CCC53671.1 conserved hypothetical protein [Trypanosoma vivax Y486]